MYVHCTSHANKPTKFAIKHTAHGRMAGEKKPSQITIYNCNNGKFTNITQMLTQ